MMRTVRSLFSDETFLLLLGVLTGAAVLMAGMTLGALSLLST